MISAEEMDLDANAISKQVLSDNAIVDQVPDDDNANAETGSSNGNDESDTPEEPELKNASLSASNYVIKSNYLNVYLKNSSNDGISNEKISLKINGKTLYATTNSNGLAKFKIDEEGKTYKVNLRFNGNSIYNSSAKTFNLRVIANPIYTKLTIAERGIIVNDSLKVYLKTKDGKPITNQVVSITIDGKTYNKTTDKNGLAKLRINRKSKINDLVLEYLGTGNYMPSSRNTQINVLNSKIIGQTSYGKVYFLSVIGNRSSKVRIAYVVGLHPLEHQIHDSLYRIMKNKLQMNYKYYIYRIVLTKKSGDYSTDRMRGQLLAKNYIVPHAKKQKFDLVVDIHSTTGTSYAKTYFIHVPKNKHEPSLKLAKKTISTIKSIEKNSKMVYWSPQSQTSPPYLHLPLINAGTPTFVFETWTYEKKAQSDDRALILTTAIDRIFG